jgi:hypothetical protein
MRPSLSRALGLGAALVLALSVGNRPATAQGFTTTWEPMFRSGAFLLDKPDPAPPKGDYQRDIAGDPTNPPVYLASDANYLFLRIRVNGDPREPSTNTLHETTGWGCAIDTDGVLTNFEYLAMADGHSTDAVRYYANTVKGTDTTDECEVDLGAWGAGNIQVSDTPSGFGGHIDKFVELAIPWNGAGSIRGSAQPIAEGTPMRFLCGTFDGDFNSLILAKRLNGDLADNADPEVRGITGSSNTVTPIAFTAAMWSDAYICNTTASASCILPDTDGDNVPDTVETALGTKPDMKDSDGDGIPDDIELTPPAGGRYAKVDSDNDGTIDALDTDSDNDGVLDKDEGYPPPASPDAGVDAGPAGVLLNTDNDPLPNYRDDDDDGDGILTKDEIADALAANVSDDVDGDGIKNWLDTNSDKDDLPDFTEGRADKDNDRIPNYLDTETPPDPDAGGSTTSSSGSTTSSSGSTTSSGGSTTSSSGASTSGTVLDAAVPQEAAPPPPPAIDPTGVAQGTGLFCSTSPGPTSPLPLLAMAAIACVAATRRANRRRK